MGAIAKGEERFISVALDVRRVDFHRHALADQLDGEHEARVRAFAHQASDHALERRANLVHALLDIVAGFALQKCLGALLGIAVSPQFETDGLVYVCDRPNDRIQIFRKDGTFVREVIYPLAATATMRSLAAPETIRCAVKPATTICWVVRAPM